MIQVELNVMMAKRNMTTGRLAKLVGITPANISILKNGKAKVSGLYSKKKDCTFAATIHMDTSGKYPQFSMTFDGEKDSKGKKANHK